MDIKRKHILRKRENGNDWLLLVTWGDKEVLEKFKHFSKWRKYNSKKLKSKILGNEGVDENEGKFITLMTYRLMNNVMTETSLYTEQTEEMNYGN